MPPPRPAPTGSAPGRAEPELRDVLEPIVSAAGFELDALDVRATGRRRTVRLVVDSDDGVGLDDIARVSRTASDELDRHEDLVGESYTLEITSPGVDRPLTVPRHWRRASRRLVAVRPHAGDAFAGRVGAVGEESVVLLVGGALREVRYADVAHAVVEVEFAPPPEEDLALLDGGTAAEHDPHRQDPHRHDPRQHDAAEDPR